MQRTRPSPGSRRRRGIDAGQWRLPYGCAGGGQRGGRGKTDGKECGSDTRTYHKSSHSGADRHPDGLPTGCLTQADPSAAVRLVNVLRLCLLRVTLSRRHLLIGMVSDGVGIVVVVAGAVVVGGHRRVPFRSVIDTGEARQRS